VKYRAESRITHDFHEAVNLLSALDRQIAACEKNAAEWTDFDTMQAKEEGEQWLEQARFLRRILQYLTKI
jgi:inactivated superfamily I helicase